MTELAGVLLAALTWYAVDPMAETPYMPDRAPAGGDKGAPVRMVAARGEYEPGSFVLVSDCDAGKVRLEVSDLRNAKGDMFPRQNLDLKTVKVWYQNGNAWLSYFSDPGLRLCPELLLNDEDLVKVDTKKGWNYARLTEKDGRVHYRWLNATCAVDHRHDDVADPYSISGQSFQCMRLNFCDAPKHCGATLDKGVYKQFFLTANVGRDIRPGVYRGSVTVSGKTGVLATVPIALRVLDFELPSPKCYFDCEKDFCTWMCEYVGLNQVKALNGGDDALAERQLVAILRDFVQHGETTPCYRENMSRPDLGRAAGMTYDDKVFPQGLSNCMFNGEPAEMRYYARRLKEELTAIAGWKPYFLFWGDEYGLATLRGAREMVKIYQDVGFRFPVNSLVGYEAGGYLADLWWPAGNPDQKNAATAFKYNQLGGDGYFGWYACHHVGAENPAFNRRQYGFGPYRAGLSCNFNYAHHLNAWNDRATDLYKPMMFVYGTGNGCVDTLQWEGFREGLDDIRYASKLKQLAKSLLKGTTDQRYAAKKALQLLADADGDDMDLTTLRLEMIRHIEAMLALSANKGK